MSRAVDIGSGVELVRAALGVSTLAARGRPGDARAVVVARRVLGVRHLVQAVLVGRARSADAHTLGAVVDVAHAASMVPLLVLGRRARAFAGTQLTTALVLALAEIGSVGTGTRSAR